MWVTLFALLGDDWVLPLSLRELFLGWKGAILRKRAKKVVMAAPLCLSWSVWKKRNRIAFDNEAFLPHKMKNFVVFPYGLGLVCVITS